MTATVVYTSLHRRSNTTSTSKNKNLKDQDHHPVVVDDVDRRKVDMEKQQQKQQHEQQKNLSVQRRRQKQYHDDNDQADDDRDQQQLQTNGRSSRVGPIRTLRGLFGGGRLRKHHHKKDDWNNDSSRSRSGRSITSRSHRNRSITITSPTTSTNDGNDRRRRRRGKGSGGRTQTSTRYSLQNNNTPMDHDLGEGGSGSSCSTTRPESSLSSLPSSKTTQAGVAPSPAKTTDTSMDSSSSSSYGGSVNFFQYSNGISSSSLYSSPVGGVADVSPPSLSTTTRERLMTTLHNHNNKESKINNNNNNKNHSVCNDQEDDIEPSKYALDSDTWDDDYDNKKDQQQDDDDKHHRVVILTEDNKFDHNLLEQQQQKVDHPTTTATDTRAKATAFASCVSCGSNLNETVKRVAFDDDIMDTVEESQVEMNDMVRRISRVTSEPIMTRIQSSPMVASCSGRGSGDPTTTADGIACSGAAREPNTPLVTFQPVWFQKLQQQSKSRPKTDADSMAFTQQSVTDQWTSFITKVPNSTNSTTNPQGQKPDNGNGQKEKDDRDGTSPDKVLSQNGKRSVMVEETNDNDQQILSSSPEPSSRASIDQSNDKPLTTDQQEPPRYSMDLTNRPVVLSRQNGSFAKRADGAEPSFIGDLMGLIGNFNEGVANIAADVQNTNLLDLLDCTTAGAATPMNESVVKFPLDESWFSVDDSDSVSKLTNPQELSAMEQSTLSLDLTEIPKVNEEDNQNQHQHENRPGRRHPQYEF